jgi:hypothetical protein
MWGDLNAPNDPVGEIVRSGRAKPLAVHLGTDPKVFYIGLGSVSNENTTKVE